MTLKLQKRVRMEDLKVGDKGGIRTTPVDHIHYSSVHYICRPCQLPRTGAAGSTV